MKVTTGDVVKYRFETGIRQGVVLAVAALDIFGKPVTKKTLGLIHVVTSSGDVFPLSDVVGEVLSHLSSIPANEKAVSEVRRCGATMTQVFEFSPGDIVAWMNPETGMFHLMVIGAVDTSRSLILTSDERIILPWKDVVVRTGLRAEMPRDDGYMTPQSADYLRQMYSGI